MFSFRTKSLISMTCCHRINTKSGSESSTRKNFIIMLFVIGSCLYLPFSLSFSLSLSSSMTNSHFRPHHHTAHLLLSIKTSLFFFSSVKNIFSFSGYYPPFPPPFIVPSAKNIFLLHIFSSFFSFVDLR